MIWNATMLCSHVVLFQSSTICVVHLRLNEYKVWFKRFFFLYFIHRYLCVVFGHLLSFCVIHQTQYPAHYHHKKEKKKKKNRYEKRGVRSKIAQPNQLLRLCPSRITSCCQANFSVTTNLIEHWEEIRGREQLYSFQSLFNSWPRRINQEKEGRREERSCNFSRAAND